MQSNFDKNLLGQQEIKITESRSILLVQRMSGWMIDLNIHLTFLLESLDTPEVSYLGTIGSW